MRIITYNVNSLKQRMPRVLALLEEHAPDIVCLQETKSQPEAFPHAEFARAGYTAVDHSGGRWEGVAILGRSTLGVTPVRAGLPGEDDPSQARWVEAEVGGIRVVSVYVPNGRAVGTEAFFDKLSFLDAMAERVADLAAGPAIVAGDMNVCPSDLDVWDATQVHGATHVTPHERTRLQSILDQGFVDAFRVHQPDEPGFSWWDYRAGHFHKGFGLRIDLVLVSRVLGADLGGAFVDRSYRKVAKVREAKPSDHAPVVVDFHA